MSFTIYSQDEGSLSTDDTTPKTFHIPMTPPRTHNKMLPRPPTENIQPLAQETKPAVKPAVTPEDSQSQPTLPAPMTSTASTHPQCTRKTPLLPTLPASARQFNNRNNYKQFIPRPSPFITRPSPIYNRFQQQPYTPRPFNHQQILLLPLLSHQIPAFTGPYPQIPGHLTLQVSYLPVLLPYLLQYYAA